MIPIYKKCFFGTTCIYAVHLISFYFIAYRQGSGFHGRSRESCIELHWRSLQGLSVLNLILRQSWINAFSILFLYAVRSILTTLYRVTRLQWIKEDKIWVTKNHRIKPNSSNDKNMRFWMHFYVVKTTKLSLSSLCRSTSTELQRRFHGNRNSEVYSKLIEVLSNFRFEGAGVISCYWIWCRMESNSNRFRLTTVQ